MKLPTTFERQDEVGRINRNIALAYAAKVKLYQAYEQDAQTHAVVNINKGLLKEVVELVDCLSGYDLLPDFRVLTWLPMRMVLNRCLPCSIR